MKIGENRRKRPYIFSCIAAPFQNRAVGIFCDAAIGILSEGACLELLPGSLPRKRTNPCCAETSESLNRRSCHLRTTQKIVHSSPVRCGRYTTEDKYAAEGTTHMRRGRRNPNTCSRKRLPVHTLLTNKEFRGRD